MEEQIKMAENEPKVEENKVYELKELETRHLFSFLKVLKHLDVKEIIANIKDGNLNETQVGFVLAAIIVANVDKCEEPLYDFIAEISNLESEQIGSLPPKVFLSLMQELVSQAGFSDFLSQAGRLVKLV